MADDFDPYHRWLGIAPDHRPPDHYQLLGVPRFESDPEVIASAADRQMAHVRSYQTGKHAATTQRVLNELAAARVCLLSPDQKARYDARLRSVHGGTSPPAKVAASPAAGGTRSTGTAAPAPDGIKLESRPPQEPAAANAGPSIAVRTDKKPTRRRRGPRPDQLVWIGMVVGIVLGIGVTVAVVYVLVPRYGKLALEMTAADRTAVQVQIDGQVRELPPKGPIEFSLRHGEHEVTVKRPAHAPFVRTIEVAPRATETVKVQLRPLARLSIEFTGRRPDNARLTIDGEAHPLPAGRALVVPCEPGIHVIRVDSPKGKFERSVTVLPEQNFRVPVAILADNRLLGRWTGTVEIDQAAVDRRLAQTRSNPLTRVLLQPTLDALRSNGTLEFQLRGDGTYLLVTKIGPLANSSSGRWGVTEETPSKVIVEFTPDQGDVEYRQFHFDDRDNFRTDLPKEFAGLGHFRCRRATN